MNFSDIDDDEKLKALFQSYPRQFTKFCVSCVNVRKDLEYGTR
jgi:hypothetical protein